MRKKPPVIIFAPQTAETRRIRRLGKKLKNDQRLDIGIALLMGQAEIRYIMGKYDISRSYCYKLKKEAREIFMNKIGHVLSDDKKEDDDSYSKEAYETTEDCNVLDGIILMLSLETKASYDDISRILQTMFHYHISAGSISQIINRYSEKASQLNTSLDREVLPVVKKLLLDEIFQNRQPVLTSIDYDSTYITTLSPEADRSAETWLANLIVAEDLGLSPEVTISDACGCILSALDTLNKGIYVQIDVFHSLKDLGNEVDSVIRGVEKMQREEMELTEKIKNPRHKKKTESHLLEVRRLLILQVKLGDDLTCLYDWVKELVGYAGYSPEEITELFKELVIPEMLLTAAGETSSLRKLRKAIHTFEEHLPRTLKFLERLYQRMKEKAEESRISYDLLRRMYELRRYKTGSPAFSKAQLALYRDFGYSNAKYQEAYMIVQDLIFDCPRASSMVENLNSRVRTFMNAKHHVPKSFFELMRLYMNTRDYTQSRKSARKGKSPAELATGKKYDFFKMLGIKIPNNIYELCEAINAA